MGGRIDPVGVDLAEPSNEIALIPEVDVCAQGRTFFQNVRVPYFIRSCELWKEVRISLTKVEWIAVVNKWVELSTPGALGGF